MFGLLGRWLMSESVLGCTCFVSPSPSLIFSTTLLCIRSGCYLPRIDTLSSVDLVLLGELHDSVC